MSIATKVTLLVALLAALLLSGLSVTNIQAQRRQRIEQAKQRARSLAGILRVAAESNLRDYGQLGPITEHVSREGTASVVFFDTTARPVAPAPEEEEPSVYKPIRKTIHSRRTDDQLFEHEGRTVYVYRVPLFTQRRRVAGAFELRLDLEQATALSEALWNRSALLALFLLVLIASVVALFSRQVIGKPIARLMRGIDAVIQGDLTATLPLDRTDEIGRIAYRFNEMTAQLRAAQDEIRDNAEAKLKLEGRLRHTEKLATIGQLSAEIAHEVGTPLNVIGGRARGLKRKSHSAEDVKKNAQIISEQVARITKIIQQVLDLSSAPAARREAVHLGDITQEGVTLLEHQTQRANITVVVVVEPHLPRIPGDPDRLQQVVLNLLLNGAQAMPAGGTLTARVQATHRRKGGLDLAPPQHYVSLIVEDTGKGIPPEHFDQIFDPFFSTKDKGQGTGLGLSVVHGIVKEHDGWIDVDPIEPRGTRFSVYLPVESEARISTDSAADGA